MKPIDELNISPWPWKNHGVEHKALNFVRVRDKDGFFVADADGKDDDNAHANGDIVAAAPEMYEALYAAELELSLVAPASRCLDIVRAALAKAAGEEPYNA